VTVEIRALDRGNDYAAISAAITEANKAAGFDWLPSAERLAVAWSKSPNFDPDLDAAVAVDDGVVVGAVRTGWRERMGFVNHQVQIWVLPERTREGIGRRLLEWGEARVRAAVAAGAGGRQQLPHVFGGVTHEDNLGGVALAEHAGYSPIRYHYEMRRDLAEPIPEAALPDGVEVRPVLPEHHRAVWQADVEAFKDHWDAAVVNEQDFVRFFAHPEVDTSLWQVAWDGDEIAGLVINGINREENAILGLDVGWLDGVSTRRPWRKRGVAGALIARSLGVLRERGMSVAALGVDVENPTGALGLYERFGFAPIRTFVFFQKPL
jgi:GNAT superfamily N-acetyltransferase